jgi:hypothetical protein
VNNPGLDFVTIALGTMPDGTYKPLGFVRWGFYLDNNDNQIHSIYDQDPPIGTGLPVEASHAIDRWNKIPGNKQVTIRK